jgi:HlyD family secretion protein
MSAVREVEHPTSGSSEESHFLDTGRLAVAGSRTVSPRKRSLIGKLSSGVSGLVTGAVAVAGLALFMLADPAPSIPLPPAIAAAAAAVAKPPSITTVRATLGPISESVMVTGNLVAREEVLVAAEIDGHAIEEILVEEGDTVKGGQILARLSRAMIDTALAQNEAQIARADAAIAQAMSTIAEAEAAKSQAASAFARSQILKRGGNTTADTLEQRELAAKTAEARLQAATQALQVSRADRNLADAQRKEMMVRLARTDIKAPSAGVVSRRTARLGAIAGSAGEPLFRIIKDGAIELEANVSESTLARLDQGMKASVVTAARHDPFRARIRLVAPEVNETTRLGRVRVAIDPAPGLKIGAFGRASVEIASREGVLVPQSAVLYSEKGATVQVVKDGVVATRSVEIGLRTPEKAEIEKGVASGEAVVATAGTFVRDGDKVTPVETKLN